MCLLLAEWMIEMVKSKLIEIGWIHSGELMDSAVYALKDAYPVLELDTEIKLKEIFTYLSQFSNLKVLGRNGLFQYTHIHDMMRFGKDAVEGYPLG